MPRPLNDELLSRREKLLQYMVKGISIKDAAREITKNITDPLEREQQIYAVKRDWSRRNEWLNSLVRYLDETFLAELVAGMKEAMAKAWIEYYRGDNSAARIGTLRTIILGNYRTGALLIEAGVIKPAVHRIEATVDFPGTPFDCDPEMRRALLEEAERQRQEKERQDRKWLEEENST